MRELSGPLPARVIADLLGVPREDREQFKAWSTALVKRPRSDAVSFSRLPQFVGT